MTPKKPFDYTRSESDLEHVAGIIYLVILFSEFFPEIILPEDFRKYILGASLHELGETKMGDISDDGNRNALLQDFEEAQVVQAALVGMPPSMRIDGLKIYDEFQRKSSEAGLNLYFLDKTEAVLNGFIQESQGRCGLFYKKRTKIITQISDWDRTNLTITGSEVLADMWGCGLIRTAKKYNYKHINILIDLLQAASLDVRGKELDWIDKALHS